MQTNVTAVLGQGFGDEGKGKIVDYLAKDYDIVVRFNGSLNAGHTIVVDGVKHVNRMLPCGLLHEHTKGVVAQGTMVNLQVLLEEINRLKLTKDRLFISDSAFIVLPIHKEIDIARETIGKDQKFIIGTTKNGIGPSFEDKVRRYGVRIHELKDTSDLTRKLINITYAYWAQEKNYTGLSDLRDIKGTVEALVKELHNQYLQIEPYLTNTALFLNNMIDYGETVLLEAAQATLLDLDFGTYPYVTSSNCTAGAICTGTGIPPKKITKIIGVTKAYVTRVGEGPFPTEIKDEAIVKQIRELGHEYGTVTKRPRRIGWLDVPMLNYACKINGIDELVMTKFDVLYDVKNVKVCLNYGNRSDNIAAPLEMKCASPSYMEFNTQVNTIWTNRDSTIDPYIQESCEKYITNISTFINTPITMYSLGPERESLFHRRTTGSLIK